MSNLNLDDLPPEVLSELRPRSRASGHWPKYLMRSLEQLGRGRSRAGTFDPAMQKLANAGFSTYRVGLGWEITATGRAELARLRA